MRGPSRVWMGALLAALVLSLPGLGGCPASPTTIERPAAVVSSYEPALGLPFTPVTIVGTGLAGRAVEVGGVSAAIESESGTVLVFLVPALPVATHAIEVDGLPIGNFVVVPEAVPCPSQGAANAAVELSVPGAADVTEVQFTRLGKGEVTILDAADFDAVVDYAVALRLPALLPGRYGVLVIQGPEVQAMTEIEVLDEPPPGPPSPATIQYPATVRRDFIPPLTNPNEAFGTSVGDEVTYLYEFDMTEAKPPPLLNGLYECGVETTAKGTVQVTELVLAAGGTSGVFNDGYGTFDFGSNVIEFTMYRADGEESYVGGFGNRADSASCYAPPTACIEPMDIVVRSTSTCRQLATTVELVCYME